jgi:GTP-binding protein
MIPGAGRIALRSMPLPRLAIIGRPNVGKSSIMNMLAKEKRSIVDPTPGTTRDRVTAIVTLEAPGNEGPPRDVELTDTGGYGAYVAEGRRFNEVGADLATLTGDIEFQISEAVATADLVLLVVDAQAGITPQDEEIARLLRERVLGGKGRPSIPVRVVANKVDGPRWEAHALEASALGFGEPLMVSAKNNYMRRELIDRLYEMVGELPGAGEPEQAPDVDMRLAIVGKRNAGKSTLVNTLAGQKRVITSEIAGTTRDAVDVRFEMDGRSFLAIDTAGLRRKKSFADRIEWFAFDRLARSIERADVCLLLIDATEPVSQVDQQLGSMITKAYKPCVITVNKWDLVQGRVGPTGKPVTPESYEEYLRKELKGLAYAPISFISAATGLNVRETIDLAFQLREQSLRRVTTGKLNRLVRQIFELRGPPSKLGTFAKLYYAAQVGVAPPTIGLVVNRPDLFDPAYERFLINRFREELPFPEVPIRLIIKGRKRKGEGGEEPFADVRALEEAAAETPAADAADESVPDHWTEEEARAFFEDEGEEA